MKAVTMVVVIEKNNNKLNMPKRTMIKENY